MPNRHAMNSHANDHPPVSTVHIHIARAHAACVAAFERYTGINLMRWRVLFMLHQHGESTQKELAERTGLDGWSITRAVKPLEEGGYVERRLDPADNRLTRVGMTDRGRAFYAELEQRRDRFLQHALNGIPGAELERLERLLMQIEKNLEGEAPSARPESDPVSTQVL